jgi:gamma-glutamyltranspeptidase/glutathione hydrolase
MFLLRLPLFRVLLVAALIATPRLSAQPSAVEAPRGMVTSAHSLASAAGLEMLRRGGNAVDAAVATGLALAVVYPTAGNLGGGGFMIIHLAADSPAAGRDRRDLVIDYRETAPAAATRDMYVGRDGKVQAGVDSSVAGWRASGVPGTVAGFALALRKYGSGKLSWAEVCAPARRLAAEGHVVSAGAVDDLRRAAPLLGQFAESKRIYLKGGAGLNVGEHWIQPDLAATFARLQESGPREFYIGETARRLAAAMAAHGGTITLADLQRYEAVERIPLRGTYRGHSIVTMPPPSSGGVALLQMLAMLEPHDLGQLGPDSAAKYHLVAEVMRRAFRDRAEYLADPDFVPVPVPALLARDYLQRRMSDFSPDRATPSRQVQPGLGPITLTGDPTRRASGASFARESTETTHFSVVDAAGNAVTNTYTLNGGFGSGVTIPGTGILMNNEMDDFTAKVGEKNMYGLLQGSANAIAPGKRPLSSMTPTLVFKDDRLVLVTGSPGGPTIINTVLQVILNVIDHGLPVMEAVKAPRVHHQWMSDEFVYERAGLPIATVTQLKAKGHVLRERVANADGDGLQGDAATIAIDLKTNLRRGAADPRSPDARAMGY